MAKSLSETAKQKKIQYFLISFVDLFGVLRVNLTLSFMGKNTSPRYLAMKHHEHPNLPAPTAQPTTL